MKLRRARCCVFPQPTTMMEVPPKRPLTHQVKIRRRRRNFAADCEAGVDESQTRGHGMLISRPRAPTQMQCRSTCATAAPIGNTSAAHDRTASAVEPVARRCWWNNGVRLPVLRRTWVRIWRGNPRPEELRTGSTAWWRSMDFYDRGGFGGASGQRRLTGLAQAATGLRSILSRLESAPAPAAPAGISRVHRGVR